MKELLQKKSLCESLCSNEKKTQQDGEDKVEVHTNVLPEMGCRPSRTEISKGIVREPGSRGGHGGSRRRRWRGGGNVGVKLLVPVHGAAVAESPDALPALGDVEGAPCTGVRHGDIPEAIPTAAALQLLLVVTLWSED